jgi:hypothetical protein
MTHRWQTARCPLLHQGRRLLSQPLITSEPLKVSISAEQTYDSRLCRTHNSAFIQLEALLTFAFNMKPHPVPQHIPKLSTSSHNSQTSRVMKSSSGLEEPRAAPHSPHVTQSRTSRAVSGHLLRWFSVRCWGLICCGLSVLCTSTMERPSDVSNHFRRSYLTLSISSIASRILVERDNVQTLYIQAYSSKPISKI